MHLITSTRSVQVVDVLASGEGEDTFLEVLGQPVPIILEKKTIFDIPQSMVSLFEGVS